MIRFNVLYKSRHDVEVVIYHGAYTTPVEKYVASFCDFEDACTFMINYLEMVEKRSD